MNYKHSCVIDTAGNYKTLVLILMEPDESGQSKESIQHYTLAEGEQLVDTAPPSPRAYAGAEGYIKPRWDADMEAWVEAATAEEIAVWEADNPAPEPPGPTEADVLSMALAELSIAQAQQKAESDQATAELSIVVATMMGGMSNV